MFFQSTPAAWCEETDARRLMDHVSKWIDRRLLVVATLAVTKQIEHLLKPSGRRFFDLTESWLQGAIDTPELRQRTISLQRTPGHYWAAYQETNRRLNVLGWEDEDDGAPDNVAGVMLYAMFAASDPAYAVSNPFTAACDCVVYTARALSPSALHPNVEFVEADRPNWTEWSTEHIAKDAGAEGQEYVDNLRMLCDVIRDVIPYPRKGSLIARAPGMYVLRTKSGELGLQQTPRPPQKTRREAFLRERPPRWWDGWIKGPEEEVLACIPDGPLLERTLRTIWPSSSSSNATSVPVPRVATSSAT